MAYAVGDIIEITFRQSMFTQIILNVLHYRVVSSTSSGSDVGDNQSTSDHFASLTGAGQLIGDWSSSLGTTWEMDDVKAQKIAPVRSAYTTSTVAVLGQSPSRTEITNSAVVVSKRGTSGTRRAQGSIHFAGWPEQFITDGEWEAPVQTWWTALEPLLSANQIVAAIPATLQPVIFNPGATPNWQTIAVWTLQPETRVMRRRTVRVGI